MSFPESLITQDPGWFAFILGAAIRVTLILGVAVIATRVLRKASARVRHALLATAIVGVLAVPFLSQVLPGWGLGLIPTLPSADGPQSGAVAGTQASEALALSDAGLLTLPTAQTYTGEGPVTDVLHTHPFQSSITVTRGAEGARVDYKGSTLHQHLGESPASESVGTSATLSTEFAGVETAAQGSAQPADSPVAAGRIGALKNWASEVSVLFWFLAVWLAGLCFFLASLIQGLRKADVLAASSVPVTGGWLAMVDECRTEAGFSRNVDVRMTPTVTAPMTWGARRPIVLLPEAAEEWSDERRRVVLRHEFAHIARNDWLFHTLSRIACAVYWLNPLAWMATRRLSIERERACDDAVISLGTKPSDYAKHLLDIAQSMTAMRGVPAVALTMARLNQLEGRIVDVLRHTGKVNRRSAWLWSIGMAALLIAVSVVEPSGSTEGAKEERRAGYVVAPLADIPFVRHIIDAATGHARHVVPLPEKAPRIVVSVPAVPRVSYVSPAPPAVGYVDVNSGGYIQVPDVPDVYAVLPDAPDVYTVLPDAPDPLVPLPGVPVAGVYAGHAGYAYHLTCDDHESCNDVAGHLAGSWVHTSDDDYGYYRVERDDGHMIFEMRNDDVELYLETRGEVEFSDDGTAITKIGDRSKVVIESREDKALFELVIRPGDGGELKYDWRVNDEKREFDKKGKEWLETALSIVHDHLAMMEIAEGRNVLAGEINDIFGERNALFGEINALHGERNSLQGHINSILGERNALLGEINAVYGQRNAAQSRINALLGERNAYEGEMNRLMGDRNHQVDRLRMIESEEQDLMQKRLEIEFRLQRGENVTEDLDRSMLELIDEQLEELQRASSQIRENMYLRQGAIAGDDLVFDSSDWEDRVREAELLRDDTDVERQVREIEERIARLDVSGQVEAINEKILQMQIEERMAEVQRRIEELGVEARVQQLEGKIKGLEVDEKVKDLEKDVKEKYKKLDRIQRDLI